MWNRLGETVLGQGLYSALDEALRNRNTQQLSDWYVAKKARMADTARLNFDNFYEANRGNNPQARAKAAATKPMVYVSNDVPGVPLPGGGFSDPARTSVDINGELMTRPVGNYGDTEVVGRGEELLAQAVRYPERAALAIPAVYLADQFLGQPIEGTIDALTLGLTNFKEDEVPPGSVPYKIPYAQGYAIDSMGNQVPNVAAPVPALSEKDLDFQIKRQQQMVATNSITLRELERMRREAQGMPGGMPSGMQPMQPTYY